MPARPVTPHAAERGFTLIEALVAIAIVTLIAFGGLTVCRTIARVIAATGGAAGSAAALEAQAGALREDAASAQAVFVPATDAADRPNTGGELDFASRTDDGRATLWRYDFDPAAQTLRRWDFDPSGATGVRDVRTGVVDGAAVYPPLTGVTRFEARALRADRLGDPAVNAYDGIAGLFAHPPRALPVRLRAPGLDLPDAAGGNGVVQVTIATSSATQLIHLAAGSLATGFTVTGVPVWHAVVYRVDQTHRFWGGLAGKSHVFINARVDVSYDKWRSPRRTRWCELTLLGAPDGLDPHDPHADYRPDEPIESAPNILAACRAIHPQPPGPDSPDGFAVNPGSVHPSDPGPTAPPCWTHPGPGGRCWPADAPPDWNPPAPAPADSPPPQWCTTHAASGVCQRGRAGLR